MDHPRRNFNPKKTARYGRPTFDPIKLVQYNPKLQYARLMNFPFRGSHFRPRMRSVVIAVDGASRGNNRADPTSRAAWGVYWGPGCASNACDTLAASEAQTSSRAELQAVRHALLGVHIRRTQGDLQGWRQFVIKLDSEYVKKTFDEYLWKWEQNGWRKSDGKKPEHLELIQDIHHMVCGIERDGAVRFGESIEIGTRTLMLWSTKPSISEVVILSTKNTLESSAVQAANGSSIDMSSEC